MKLYIHDLEKSEFERLFHDGPGDSMVISDDQTIQPCIGCFGCWVKTPGICVIRDPYRNMGFNLSRCDELILISKCSYGGFSPFVKNVLDRSISYLHPYFANRNAEMHHRMRYQNEKKMKVLFYGADITEVEKETARKLAKANSINHCSDLISVSFVDEIGGMEGQLL